MINPFFFQLITIISGFVILAVSYLGMGWFFSRLLKISFFSENRYFHLIWLGWAITLLLLQFFNLFTPINANLSIPILVIGSIIAIIFLRMEFVKGSFPSFHKVDLAFVGIAVLWVSLLSMRLLTVYDSGLYHFNAIRWLNESPIVLGLGNLHGRFAFNQSFFTYVAFLNIYPFFDHGYNLANGFLLLLLLSEGLLSLSKSVIRKSQKEDFGFTRMATILFLPTVIFIELTYPTTSPDTASSILQILIFIIFIYVIEITPSDPENISLMVLIFIISATAVTVKLSNLFYILSIILTLLIVNRKPLRVSRIQEIPFILKLISVPALIILIWGLRGVLLSGCPVYPLTVGCTKAPWAVPIASVKSEADWIYSWARLPGENPAKVLNSWEWIKPWFSLIIRDSKTKVIYPVFVFLISIIISFLAFFRQPLTRKENEIWFLVPLPILIGLTFWFLLAPDVRFANSLFWILPVAGTITLFKILGKSGKLQIGIILFAFIVINANSAYFLVRNPMILVSFPRQGFAPIPVANLIQKKTLSGLKIFSPSEGQQCWNSKLPCTPYFNPELNFTDNIYFDEFSVVSNAK